MYPSNTETPRYYAEFREEVLSGRILVCENISLQMNRIDEKIKNPDFYFDPRPVEAYINFCQTELTKTDGTELILLDSFKLWAEDLLGWYYYTEESYMEQDEDGSNVVIDRVVLKRLTKKQYLIVARGAAKSMYGSTIQAYFLTVDGKTSHQITTAPTMKQAEEIVGPIRTALSRSPGPLFEFLTTPIKGVKTGYFRTLVSPTKKGVENFLTNSLLEVRPMTIDKLQGLRPKISTIDEWLSGDVREDVVGAIEQGASKLNDYIIVAMSSEGTVRNGSGDEIKLELQKILVGEYEDPHTSIFHYQLDDISEVADPNTWIKAQPNLGLTVQWDAYFRDVKRAELAPATRNDILAKRFGIPMEGYTYFFLYEETIPHTPVRLFKSMDCAMGADLSQGDDFCSFAFLFPLRGGLFGIKTISFITDRTLSGLGAAMRQTYDKFIAENSLIVLEGTVLDMKEVFYTLDDEILARDYNVMALGYDPYNSEQFIKLYQETNGPYGIEVVRQGSRTESVPLGEIKKLAEDRMLIFDEHIFSFAMGNTMVMEDTNGNRKIYKKRYDAKIDPVAAAMDAYVAYTRRLELFK